MDSFLCFLIVSINEFAPGAIPLGDCDGESDPVGPLLGFFLLLVGVLALFL